MRVRVLIADDQELVRLGFRMVLDAQEDISVVGEAGDGKDAVRQALELRPAVVLMDVRMPSMNGIEATRRIVEAVTDTRVLILTTFDLDAYVLDALRAGASGFLLKDAPPDQLISAIRTIATGDAVVAPTVTRRLLDSYRHLLPDPDANDTSHPDPRVDSLTPREREVLLEIAAGHSNGEIATRLYVTEATVKTHVGNIFLKLGLRDRVQAVIFAYERGLTRPGAGSAPRS
ncbi:MAG: response regulator transcription factor [Actinobacteria bacterium]|nr:response regulator transcription factor [Actinomycetota bacterium]